ncbi:TPA_asm: oncoid [Powellomyces chytrid fungus MELD virus 1]|nr:TPA_asm: oncoid [Powellomyces chytrid fungus MELD virus 1]
MADTPNNSPPPTDTTTTTMGKRRPAQQLAKGATKRAQPARVSRGRCSSSVVATRLMLPVFPCYLQDPSVHEKSTPEGSADLPSCWKCHLFRKGKMFTSECHHLVCRPCIVAAADDTVCSPFAERRPDAFLTVWFLCSFAFQNDGPQGQLTCGAPHCGRVLFFAAIPAGCQFAGCNHVGADLRMFPCNHLHCMGHVRA